MAIEAVAFWLCYKKQKGLNFQIDRDTGRTVLPPGCTVETELVRTDLLSEPYSGKITPRWWFAPSTRS